MQFFDEKVLEGDRKRWRVDNLLLEFKIAASESTLSGDFDLYLVITFEDKILLDLLSIEISTERMTFFEIQFIFINILCQLS